MGELIFGIVINNFFYSNKMEFILNKKKPNGIYSIDMSEDAFKDSIAPADLNEANIFFKKASKIKIIRGISFHDGIIPENPVAYDKMPLKVQDPTYEEFEEIEVVSLRNKIIYFIRTLNSPKTYILMDLKQSIESKNPLNINSFKDITPEMRLVYAFHLFEKKQKEILQPAEMVKKFMKDSGAIVKNVKKVPRGFEILWDMGEWTINTLVNNDYRVIEAGFCVSGYDNKHSTTSISLLCKDYIENHGHLVITRN